MTFTEEMLVWQEQFLPGCYNLPPFARILRGDVDLDALQAALTEIYRRHQALRTNFRVVDGRPVQVVRRPGDGPEPLTLIDLLGQDEPTRDADLARLIGEATNRTVDLALGSLFEPMVIRLAAREHLLVLPMHHCVWDAWSVGIFHREMSAIYADLVAKRYPSPAAPVWQMGDFSVWQHDLLDGDEGRTQHKFWEEELAGAPVALQLPIGNPDLPPGTPHPAARPVSVLLPAPLAASLRAIARSQRSTPFMVTLAAFGALVQRVTGQDDFVLSSVVANRNRTEVEGTIGCVAKRIPLRLRLGGDPTFPDLVGRAREALLNALAHQDVPDEVILADILAPAAARIGLAPALTVMFQGLTVPRARLEMAGVEVENFDPTTIISKKVHAGAPGGTPWGAGIYGGTSLALFVSEDDRGITCLGRGPFHRPAVERLFDAFRTLVESIVAAPERPLSEFNLGDSFPPVPLENGEVDLAGFRIRPVLIEEALAGCPAVKSVVVSVEGGDLVARVVPAGPGAAPTLAGLRRHLWSQLPGYAWPSRLVVEGAEQLGDVPAAPEESSHLRLLSDAWAEALGVEAVDPWRDYRQSFAFVDAVASARAGGIDVPSAQVMKHRTLATLGPALDAIASRS